MAIHAIIKLARQVLDTNCFVFEGKYYQQVLDGALGSPFTMTLANIYILKWEHSLIEFQKANNEICGRYRDDVFLTADSLHQLCIKLNIAEKKDDNVRVT
ncbi:unnamed protein product [Adineta ricciae]|uniref:Reverse transcriptase domain-containing protein n=1 Tax=Adineta ricciae TaxID=249248 RepID=A0A815UP71_ADIRI|nr:unnamed protein product [Adineta ricciae]